MVDAAHLRAHVTVMNKLVSSGPGADLVVFVCSIVRLYWFHVSTYVALNLSNRKQLAASKLQLQYSFGAQRCTIYRAFSGCLGTSGVSLACSDQGRFRGIAKTTLGLNLLEVSAAVALFRLKHQGYVCATLGLSSNRTAFLTLGAEGLCISIAQHICKFDSWCSIAAT